MIIERVLEAVLFVVAAKTAIALFSAPDEPALVLGRRLSRRRLPVAAIIVALAEWQWGRLIAAVIWLTAAWAPIGHLAGLAGYHVSAANATAYTAGSSGATYFTAGTLCTALVCSAAGRVRLLGLVAPTIALVMWIATNDGHGVLFTEGFVLGALLWAALRALRVRPPLDSAAPDKPRAARETPAAQNRPAPFWRAS